MFLQWRSSLGWLLLLCSFALAGADWRELRDEALRRPRRVIINNDGCDMTEFPAKLPVTRENIFGQMLNLTVGANIDTVTYCPFTVGHAVSARTSKGDVHTLPAHGKEMRNLTAELIAQGTDPLQLATEFCRTNQLEIFLSMRVNDVHDSWYAPWLPAFKKEHPEFLVGRDGDPRYGGHTAYDFAFPEVRKRFAAIVSELMANYDLDGLELDFLRDPILFHSVAMGYEASEEERSAFTAMMREIATKVREISTAKQRGLLIAVRIPDSVELCRRMGLDLEAWAREGSIDLLITGGDRGRYSPLSTMVAFARRHKLKVYGSVDSDRTGVKGQFSRNNTETYRGATSAVYAAGADGVYYFNMFYVKAFFSEMERNNEKFQGKDKRYFARYHKNVDNTAFGPACNRIIELIPGSAPIALTAVRPLQILLEVGDDFSHPAIADREATTVLTISSLDTTDAVLLAEINDHKLGKGHFDRGVYHWQIDPTFLKLGENMVTLTGSDSESEQLHTILSGQELLQGAARKQWRRLFSAHDFAHSEVIVEDSYRLMDSGQGEADIANFIYPLPDLSDSNFRARFELMVEESTAPDAVVVRVANGAICEVVRFEKKQISFAYANVSVPFDTTDFHRYDLSVSNGTISLSADDRALLSATTVMSVDDPRGTLRGAHTRIKFMDERSFLLGSLSGPGIGSARWRNVQLGFSATMLTDLMLTVKFPEKPDEALVHAIETPPPAQWRYAAVDSRLPENSGWENLYKSGFCTVNSDGTFTLNHDHPKDRWQLIRLRPGIADGVGIVVATCEVKSESEPGMVGFSMVLRPQATKGVCWDYAVKLRQGEIETPWGNFPLQQAKEFHQIRMAIAPATGMALIWVDGKRLGGGRAPSRNAEASSYYFGDGSGEVTGRAYLREFTLSQLEAGASVK